MEFKKSKIQQVMKTVMEIAKEYAPDASDEELDFLIWEKTGFPSFWRIGIDGLTAEECFRNQLATATMQEYREAMWT